MRFIRHFICALAAAAFAVPPLAPPAQAADYILEYGADAGYCTEPKILRKIQHRFRHQVQNVPRLPDVAILEFRNIYQKRYLPELEDRPIARLYCGATVMLSDGHSRDIWYLIEEGMGFASIGNNVEFCVSGFDRWNVYNAHCRVLQ